ncbi:MAG: hypothetical protein IPI00_18865 [Flavobacteriales bacterium]|nr:hypothetical protein [Flavobacteriales bacterium]MBK6943144.1 hypothetical protein [Flavobacteriales bacterium]MBK7242160.1 hypothetical protein [Flavobacteriales bacterium]MBK7298869.1 hypothetical protein [Flavobacteriales bacterium]MBK9534551.1 hypothetical protein [Flavobacteriales bacterium]
MIFRSTNSSNFGATIMGLAIAMAMLLFVAPVLVSSITEMAKVANCGNAPAPILEEEVAHAAKLLPDPIGLDLFAGNAEKSTIIPAGPDALLSVKHGDVPDPPPWC